MRSNFKPLLETLTETEKELEALFADSFDSGSTALLKVMVEELCVHCGRFHDQSKDIKAGCEYGKLFQFLASRPRMGPWAVSSCFDLRKALGLPYMPRDR